MRRLRTALLFAGILVMSAPAALAGDEFRRTITVNGQGKAFAPPDMATVQTGVVTHGVTAGEALSANSQVMEKIMDVLKGHKLASKDIQTSSFHVTPDYRRDERGRREPEIVGYRVTNQVGVRVRNLPDLGQVLDALVQAGSNQVSGIRFGIDDPAGALNQARNRAIADARSRAELYAKAAGVRAGRVLAISEQQVQLPGPQHLARGLAAEALSSVPVAPGEHEFHVSINVVFALDDP